MCNWLKKYIADWLTYEKPFEGFPLCDFERILYEIKPCDVLLIEGRSHVSNVIKQITQSAWTHSCLYIGRIHDIDDDELRELLQQHYQGPPNKQLIIEGFLGKGLVCAPIDLYKDYHIRISRPRGLMRKDAQKVLSYAIRKLGSEYDVRQLYDMWRFFVPWGILPRRWRSSLFENPESASARIVCSTVIAEAFQSVKFPILPLVKKHGEKGIELFQRNPKILTPKDFDYSPYFDIIKYPFTQFIDTEFYHSLPWNEENEVISEAPSQYSTEIKTKIKSDDSEKEEKMNNNDKNNTPDWQG